MSPPRHPIKNDCVGDLVNGLFQVGAGGATW